MQVATLFRESASLLGASMMEAGAAANGNLAGSNDPSSGMSSPSIGNGSSILHHHHYTSGEYNPAAVNFSTSNKYKLNMKLEPQDDGYETSGDMMLTNTAMSNHHHHHHHQQEHHHLSQSHHSTTTPGPGPGAPGPGISTMKIEDKMDDPYSFIDDDPLPMMQHSQHSQQQMQQHCNNMEQMPMMVPSTGPKKRGRKKKIKPEDGEFHGEIVTNALNGVSRPIKERKKHDRFNGMPEEEVSKRTLPDHLTPNLDIIIIGINPGLFAAYKGHHYAGPGNHFWKCLYLSGLTPQQMCADEDYKLLQVGIGFTNMVARATKGSADLTRKEIKEGSQILLEKLRKFRPKIAVFNGKLIYEVFSGKKDFKFGRQPDVIEGTNTYMWVMPSSSARCAQLPRAADKVPFYAALKKFRDYLNGIVTQIDESEMVFSEPGIKSCYEAEPSLDNMGNTVIKNEDGTTTLVPGKKKRGRPKKIKIDGEETPKQQPKKASINDANNCDFPKKKRGRPKKVKVEDVPLDGMEVAPNGTNLKHFTSSITPSPIQSPASFYHMTSPALTPPNSSSNLYPLQQPQYQSPRPPFSQSPARPHSQPFTHSDLSSEISAAISSEQLGSPASPSLGPPDFDPPTSMTEEAECRLASPPPTSTTTTDHQHYPNPYYSMDPPEPPPQQTQTHFAPSRQPQDMASKSLSGLESLVDQIPSITDGETQIPDDYSSTPTAGQFGYQQRGVVSPVPTPSPSQVYSNYSNSYPIYPTPTWSTPYDPVPLTAYPHQLPSPYQSYPPGLHVPSPNYPHYYAGYPHHPHHQPTHPPGYPPYLGGF